MRGWILATFLLLACGSSSPGGTGPGRGTDGGSGSSSGGASNPPPDAFVLATLGPASHGTCPPAATTTSTVFALGTATGGHPDTVQNGASAGGGVASVKCTVHPNGAGFDVTLSAEVSGPLGGSLNIGPDTVPMSGGQGVGVSVAGGAGAVGYSQTPCTLTYVYNGNPVPASPPIAAGRIWGHASCINASSTIPTGPTGFCDLEADFVFEQCEQ
ncbi:MAG TPA: hypothetical protein VMI75_18365 [Polyangiaceae bacterium]|nr:hypothetical protein [Polyangiaceae bacterium]